MAFSSALFLFVFLPLVFFLSRIIKDRVAQNVVLACASILFYAFGQLKSVPLLLLSALVNYIAGCLLQKSKFHRRKPILTAAVVFNLLILCFFKYTDFLLDNLNALFGCSLQMVNPGLPIGISFFTFQGISYIVDVYREPKNGTYSFLNFLLYFSFFPQLIMGPIIRYPDIAEQITDRHTDAGETAAGLRRFIRGLAKKLLIAGTAGGIVDSIYSAALPAYGSSCDIRLMWLAAVCYMLQIYYDFSGYSDMALGLGKMFGFTFRENFSFPYGADSIRDFWRRWHISLSSWFRDYLYIPLGGNRKGRIRTEVNKFIVFLCTGFWHGANWTFILWGIGHGILITLEDFSVIPVKRLKATKPGMIFCRAYTLLAVCLLFVLFRADTTAQGLMVLNGMFAGNVTADGSLLLYSLLTPAAVTTLVTGFLLAGNFVPRLNEKLTQLGVKQRAVYTAAENILHILLMAMCVMSLARGGYTPFIYAQF